MSSDWQRLSPFSILFFSARGLSQLLNIYPALIGAFVTVQHFDWTGQQILLGIGGVFLILILGATLYYLNFYYIQEEDHFLIRSGIFAKNRLELPFNKIQNVTLKQPFYYRPFGLVILNLDSAGSSQKEVGLAALSRKNAEAIKSRIQHAISMEINRSEIQSDDREAELSEQNTTQDLQDSINARLLISRSNMDIILHGITHNRAWFLLAVLAPFFEQINNTAVNIISNAGFDLSTWMATKSVVTLGFTLLFLGLVFIFFMSLISVLGSIFALYDFRLEYGNNAYTRKSGLLNKYEIQVKHSRIQSIRYIKNWMDMLLNRLVMVMEPFGAQSNLPSAIMQKILVPSINDRNFDYLSAHVFKKFLLERQNIKPISNYYIFRKFYTVILPLSLSVAIFSFVSKSSIIIWTAATILISLLVIYRFWQRYGWALIDEYVVVRTGFLGLEYYCFPRHKVQQVHYYQSLFLKRKKLASIKFVLASRAISLPFINEKDALLLINSILHEVEFSDRSWM